MLEKRNITYKKESMAVLFGEGHELLSQHFKEIAHYQDIKLEPDIDIYMKLELAGLLECFTARENGELIGYSVFFIKQNPHYKSSKQAVQDILFISKERRGFGMAFIKWCDEELKNLGVQAVYHHVKKTHDFGSGLERMGYELIDLIYGKRLDKGA